MSKDISIVVVPQLGVNDEKATIVEWHVAAGDAISSGNSICTLETAKATYDVEAYADGIVLPLVKEGEEVAISSPIALIGPSLSILEENCPALRNEISKTSSIRDSHRATQKAINLAEKLGVDLSSINANGIIREQEVLQHSKQKIDGDDKIDLSWEREYEPVVVYGAGKGAVTIKECIDFSESHKVVCFVDDDHNHGLSLIDLPVYHSSKLEEIVHMGVKKMACGVADGRVRFRIRRQSCELGILLINVIHPSAYIAPSVKLGFGNYIKAGAIIETNTVVGDCCIIDNGAIIAHDCIIEDGCHLAPGVVLGSSIRIKEFTILGIGASVATNTCIGRSSIISVGSSVVCDIPDFVVIDGVPGKVVGKRKQ